MGRTAGLFLLALGSVLSASCATLSEELAEAQIAFEDARYENALVWLDDLERHTPEMDPGSRARFYYMRGMTAYRLGVRTDALHYLALAREVAGENGAGLSGEWRQTLARTLTEIEPGDTAAPTAGGDAPTAAAN